MKKSSGEKGGVIAVKKKVWEKKREPGVDILGGQRGGERGPFVPPLECTLRGGKGKAADWLWGGGIYTSFFEGRNKDLRTNYNRKKIGQKTGERERNGRLF